MEEIPPTISSDSNPERPPPTRVEGEGPPPDAGPLPERVGPYLIHSELGRGGMAVVYRARRPDLGRDFALKVIRPERVGSAEALGRFRREAQVAAALAEHPAIVAVHDIGEADGALYLAMDLIEGRTLHGLLQQGPLPTERVAEILETAARAVHFAHARGFLHRDIKPGNILIGRRASSPFTVHGPPLGGAVSPPATVNSEPSTVNCFLTDFGIARLQAVGPEATQLTRAGQVVGSPDYMSPEQAQGHPLDARSDVYSLGASLYECLTGAPPFRGESLHGLLREIIEDEVVPPSRRNPQVPRALDTIATKCLETRPELRYPTAEALADDLARYRRGEAIGARRAGPFARAARRVGRNPAPTAAGAVALLALAAAGGVLAARAARDEAAIAASFEAARGLVEAAPEQALGLLEAVRQRSPERAGLPAAIAAARRRAEERGIEAREREAASLRARGDEHRKRYTAAPPDEREPLWQQALAFYLAARSAGAPGGAAAREASDRLAEFAWERLREAEAEGRAREAARFESLVREHGAERFARELEGAGTLSLDTDPAGAEVECRRYREAEPGRLEDAPYDPAAGSWPASPVSLGRTPLSGARLPRGSYLLVLRREGHRPVQYPVLIERLEAERTPRPVRLLTEAEIGEGWIYVPAGEALLGGDSEARSGGPRRRVPVGGFLLMEREVTVAEYHEFLAKILRAGAPEAEVTARCPRYSFQRSISG
ncbi:MAG: bifunctional serine/threonine-protein kinase/formylglycine-generating enzyme family protein [Planctomycetales bacterium]|nr:bifunctional serine/threonine-protein kinase/formylglycine-generating enzyme family protein [Planctomycetales bacterium]